MPTESTATPSVLALQKRALAVLAGLPTDAVELGRLFQAAGHELALVGGPVRDAFLGRLSADLDFTTSATPEQTEAILARWGLPPGGPVPAQPEGPLRQERGRLEAELARLTEPVRAYAGTFHTPDVIHRLRRGDVMQKLEVVGPG